MVSNLFAKNIIKTNHGKYLNTCDIKRFISNIKIAVIGSGPSGFYTTQALLKNNEVHVDIYEKAVVPFGLIRFGVAPDHPEVKNVISSFNKIALNNRVTFNGNINIGTDVTLEQLRKAYNVVVLCYGSSEDRKLNIEGENLPCVLPAKRFVGWYNGVEEDKNLDFNLDTEEVVIIGQGNVALDCARILLTDVDEHLKTTDITDYALSKLKKSKVKKVHIVGRRGPLQVAFKIKELREMTKIKNLDIIISNDNFRELIPEDLSTLPRPEKRLTELLLNIFENKKRNETNKKLFIHFLLNPVKIEKVDDSLSSIFFNVNVLNDNKFSKEAKVKSTVEVKKLNMGLLIRSIGYKAVSIDKCIPIDEKTGIIENKSGLITSLGKDVYCSGWAATGATGVILGTMNSSFLIGKTILKHIEKGSIDLIEKPGRDAILNELNKKNIKIITFEDWLKIDSMERFIGQSKNKPREKFVNTEEILNYLKKNKN